MKNEQRSLHWQPYLQLATGVLATAVLAFSVDAQTVLGPTPPIETADGANWFSGSSGTAYVSVADTNFLYGSAQYAGVLSNSVAGSANHADFRCGTFALNGAKTVDFSFYYYAPNVNGGDNIRVDLRMYLGAGDVGFIADNNEHPFTAGTMSGYAFFDSGPITVPANANYADIRVSVNIFGDDTWSSGAAYFDDFLVTTPTAPPYITQQPVSALVNANTAFTNTVVAGGLPPLSYQWYENGSPVTDDFNNGTNYTLILSSVQPRDNSTNYYVVVTNDYGAVTSTVASLIVNTNLTLVRDIYPTDVTLFAGGHPTFSIGLLAANDAPPYGFQWYSNNVAIPGATSASYTLMSDLSPGFSGTYHCVVTNAYATLTSADASVTVIPAPTAQYPVAILAANPVGFWRLNEVGPNGTSGPNNGVVAHDYWGGNNGFYTNTVLDEPGYNQMGEPTETSAGWLVFSNGMAFNIPTNVDFSAPAGGNSSFTVECWVNGYAQTTDAGIVSKGVSGGEQFDLDTGSHVANSYGGTDYDFRFFVRDAAGAVHGVNSTNALDGNWHHLVGVCDEAAGYVALFVDGVLVGTNTITPGSGILASDQGMKIGSRPSGSDPNYNADQFQGYIDDVAVYNYALTSTQVREQFGAVDTPAKVAVQPPNTIVANQNGNATISAVVVGTPPVTNQWWDLFTGQPLPGQTNTTLMLNNIQYSQNGDEYYLTTSNAFGGAQSTYATLTVVSGKPQIQPYGQDVQTSLFAVVGGTVSDSVTAYGTEPLTYRWQFQTGGGWVNLTDGSGIAGSQSNVLTIADAKDTEAGFYQVIISNNSGSITSSVAQLTIGGNPIGFNGNGAGWTGTQTSGYSTPIVTNGLLTLTDGAGGEARSFFFNYPQYIGAFKASFTYQDVGGGGADGTAFVLQNDARGPSALGGAGGSLGVSGITPSAELEMNVFGPDNGVGYTFATDGQTPANVVGLTYLAPGPVAISSGDPIGVTLHYDGQTLSMTMTDAVASVSFSTNLFTGNLASVVGANTAYVGFTGSDGGVSSTQIITNFSFVSIPTAAFRITTTNTAVISWPGTILGYVLQQNSNLATTNWLEVTNPVKNVNGQNQVVVPVTGSNEFYRLEL